MQENNVIPLDLRADPKADHRVDSKAGGGDRKKSQMLLDESRNITLRYLPALLQRMLDNADDALFELADKAESNVLQTNYFDAMRELRLQRKTLEDGYKSRLEAGFNRFLTPAATPSIGSVPGFGSADTMSLVDDSDFEESLAVTTMVTKIKSRLATELYAIERRFAALAPTRNIDLDVIPVGPKAICEAFRDALQPFDAGIDIKLIIYKLFDKYVASNLEPLYEENNTLFAKAGVLPNLKMSVKKQPRAAQSIGLSSEAPFSDTPTGQSLESGAGYSRTGEETLLGTLQQLLARQRTAAMPMDASDLLLGSVAHPPVHSIDIINALSGIQRRNISISSFESVTQLKKALSSEIHSAFNGDRIALISPADNDIIDIVAMLFDFILDDQNLPPVAKALLSRLQIPLLKVAISDHEFFSKKQHPARRLLNQMAQAAAGIDEEVRIEGSPLLQKIDQVVTRILNEFDDNVALFDELLIDFESFQRQPQPEKIPAEAATQKQGEARERHKLTSAWVMECIASRIKDRKLPKAVYELIAGPWREVMVQTYLNNGDEDMRWKEQLRFVDLLIWSVEPKKSDTDKKRLANILLELLITLQDGLKTLSMKQEEMDHLLLALESCHIASMRGENSATHAPRVRIKLDTSDEKLPALNEIDRALAEMQSQLNKMSKLDELMNIPILGLDDIVVLPKNDTVGDDLPDEAVEEITITSEALHGKVLPLIDDEYWQQTLNLQSGQWLNLVDENGREQRVRLVWKSDYLGECTFSNWKFKVVTEISFNDLAAKFRRGEAALIEELPLFERAIDAVVNRLHQRAAV